MDGRTCLQNVDPSMALDNNHRNVLRSSTLRPAANGSNCLTTRRPHDLFKLANHFEEKVRSTRPRDLASSKTRAVGMVGLARARAPCRERWCPCAPPRKPKGRTLLKGDRESRAIAPGCAARLAAGRSTSPRLPPLTRGGSEHGAQKHAPPAPPVAARGVPSAR